MASPDIRSYIDLTLHDVDSQDVYLAALDSLRNTLPEFEPREGSIELVLLQALAEEVAETVFSINRLPSAVVEAFLKLYGLTRSVGVAPTTTLTFTATGPETIPLGTRVILVDVSNINAMVFTTGVATTLTDIGGGLYRNSTPVAATGASVGAYFNNYPTGTTMLLVDTIPSVQSVVTASLISNGSDPETDTSYFTRASGILGRLTQALVIPSQFDTYITSNFTFASRVKTLDGVVETAGTRTSGSSGYVGVIACGPGGTLLSGAQKTSILDNVQDICQANLVINVYDPCITLVNITAGLKAISGSLPTATASAAIVSFASPDTWDWDTTLRKNELIAVLDGVSGVDYVDSLTMTIASATMGAFDKTGQFSIDGSGNATLSGSGVVGGVLYKANNITINWV